MKKGKMKNWTNVSSREWLKETKEEVDHEQHGVMTSEWNRLLVWQLRVKYLKDVEVVVRRSCLRR